MINLDDNMKLFKEVSTKSLKSADAFGQLNLQAWNQLAEKQMEIISLATEASVESLNVLTKTKDVQNLTEEQTKISKEFGEKLNVKNQELAEITAKVRDEFSAFAQEQASQLNVNLNQVAKQSA
ncbi:phasin family protein [Psychrobium sp. 1_MG-2023]|uniref:phasin family protein n=1 Tax=Psychrobium sp. 1_MG-2023 TaxID=3062624 RepID=UPI0026B86F69|nr:phasin family protein [Psychrobium sp. 1_MG-2023]MDP2559763.1 phasin family protein [Psychrobium sp. 1_MG-2023]